MAKHTQTICWQLLMNCLTVFDNLAGLPLRVKVCFLPQKSHNKNFIKIGSLACRSSCCCNFMEKTKFGALICLKLEELILSHFLSKKTNTKFFLKISNQDFFQKIRQIGKFLRRIPQKTPDTQTNI